MAPAVPIGAQTAATWRWTTTTTMTVSAVVHGVASGCILPPLPATSSPIKNGGHHHDDGPNQLRRLSA